jgi:hypothetical protein
MPIGEFVVYMMNINRILSIKEKHTNLLRSTYIKLHENKNEDTCKELESVKIRRRRKNEKDKNFIRRFYILSVSS